jgi:mannose-1-phosphate guanylyltransferase
MVQAVIVAAGGGSRLYPITDVVPKTMLPVGIDQRPMAEMIIRHCLKHGIRDFVFCLSSESGKQVENYFGDGSRFKAGVVIKYSYSDEPQGTSGEIKIAYNKGIIKNPALIYYGDTLCSTNLTEMMALDADVSVVVNDLVTMPYGFIQDFQGCATKIVEKPTIREMIPIDDSEYNFGAIMSVYYVKNIIFFHKYCDRDVDVSKDILHKMIEDGFKVMTYHDNEPFLDVGNWKNYEEAQKWTK